MGGAIEKSMLIQPPEAAECGKNPMMSWLGVPN
jgi:hypothetical protein